MSLLAHLIFIDSNPEYCTFVQLSRKKLKSGGIMAKKQAAENRLSCLNGLDAGQEPLAL
jgi:hypothetical protein